MANRPKDNRAEQDNAPNMKLINQPQGGIHAATGTGVAQETNQAMAQGNQAGQNPRT